MIARLLWLALSATLAACGGADTGPSNPRLPGALPPQPVLGAATPAGDTAYANADLVEVFVRLTHDLEWGGRRPGLSRLDEPVTLGLTGAIARRYTGFVDRLLADLQRRAGIAIARGPAPQNLTVHLVPGPDFRARVPAHLCIVAPGRHVWASFREAPEAKGTRAFETTRAPEAMTVFIPDTLPPYLIRACLVEEIVQALGPANDLDDLGTSIFNDDGVHLWPTALDFLMLRVLYDPMLRNDMTRRETRAAARTVLDRINPAGRNGRPLPVALTRDWRQWSEAQRAAFARGTSLDGRLQAARRAAELAGQRAPGGVRHCRALIGVARLTARSRPANETAIREAMRACAAAHGPADLRLSLLRLALARAALAGGDPARALRLTENLVTPLAAHRQEERLAALYTLQAAALGAIERPGAEARAVGQARDWAAYALGRNGSETARLEK